jgi:hypothetical protein
MFPQGSVDGFLRTLVRPCYEALRDPKTAQSTLLRELIERYRKTTHGRLHSADDVESVSDFQRSFPIVNYRGIQRYLEKVKQGEYDVLLSERPVCWVMTRGSTGTAKVLPVTKTHLDQIFSCGARALVNYALTKTDYALLTGKILNLNFPSSVSTMEAEGELTSYGYSSGTYAKLNPMLNQVSLLPKQEEIDALGGGIAKQDWERRFELVYRRSREENVVAAMGVTPVILSFAKYIEKAHGKKPRDLWRLRALFCTSVKKIQFKYAPRLRSYFGEVPIVEMYTATEGVFGQQLDDFPYISPNYDCYLFEVETKRGVKMLHELRRGEWGRLIVSSCLFPRYDMGDMVEAMGKNYFRIFGRATALTILEHRLYRLLYGWYL